MIILECSQVIRMTLKVLPINLRATQHSASPFCARSLLVSPVKKDECDSILHCGCVEKMSYFHGVYRHEGNPMTRNGYGTHDAYGV